MFPKRPRIDGFPYVGFHRYSLTICTNHRKPVFTDADVVAAVLTTIRQWAAALDFAVFAYCFMPDHLHLIVSATSDASDLCKYMKRWKQGSGYDHRQRNNEFLSQPSYFDHVLRDDEDTQRAVKYVLENPVRKGLVADFGDYPFCGSDVFSLEELRDFWRGQD
jgi:putative transposase